MTQNRTSIPPIPYPLAEIGPLPRDLLAAFNSAVSLARNAQTIRNLVEMPTSPDNARMVAQSEQEASDAWDDCRQAILSVTNELNDLRSGPACFGTVQAANAHLAALDFSVKVSEAIRMALILAKARRVENCQMAQITSEAIIEHYDSVREHLRGEMSSWPNGEEIIAGVQWEAGAAASRRSAADRSAARGAEESHPESTQAGTGRAGKQRRKRRQRGRPTSTDLQTDKRVYDAWKSKRYKNYKELALEMRISESEVKLIIDRERKRRRNRKSRQSSE
jgi:hypothetical protein